MDVTSLVAQRTLSNMDISLLKYGHHTLLEYFILGLTIDVYSLVKISLSIKAAKSAFNYSHK